MLLNLVHNPALGLLLDPFAGAGGVVIEALASGWEVIACDVDPGLRHGLRQLGAQAIVADARSLPIASESVDAIATEPTYDLESAGWLDRALSEASRVLRSGGRMSVLCASWQADPLRSEARRLALHPLVDSAIDRKGTPVVALLWRKRD
jgi:tRNA G10  N-methylase Trm11